MKYILHIIAKLYIGGAEKVARDIGLYAPEGYENHYVVFGDEVGEYEEQLIEHGCKVFHMPPPSKSYMSFMKNLKELMREYDYTAVHAHTMFSIGWAMLAAKQMNVPVRVAHAHSALRNDGGFVKDIYEVSMRRIILKCSTDLVGCGLDAGNRLFGEKAFSQRGKLILNGIDTEQFAFNLNTRAMMREKLGLMDSFVIGHTGHLTSVKNQKFLIELMPELLKRKDNAVLLLLGEGEDRKMLEDKISELGLQDKVIMTGNVPNVKDYLCAMDVFAFPSLYEGMPLSIVEVQANGLPCVISNHVPKDVFLTDLLTALSIYDAEQWVDAICTAERNHSEKYAGLLKESGFDIRPIVKRFYDIYERN